MALAALLTGCGGGGGSSPPPPPPPPTGSVPAPAPAPPPSSTAGCSLQNRQVWAANQLYEWYLFPETLPPNPVPTQDSVNGYIDALTATARAQGRDRFFTYVTSIAEENAFFNSGSSAGFGVRLSTDAAQRRVFVAEAFENAPALNAGIDRGTEILAIGTSASNMVTVSSIISSQGSAGVSAALGPSDPGVTRTLQISDASGTRTVTISKADYELTPVSSRYGARIIEDGGRRVGYVNLRTFISTADPALRNVFAQFRAQGITEIVIDLRYNGGGLVSIANLMGDLLGGNRSTSEVFSFTRFRPEKSANDSTRFFMPQAQSVAATRLAFIGTKATASASELVINSFVPYLGSNLALVGTDTFGKPVGQIALDRAQCDDRLRVIAFSTQNAAGRGDYFTGVGKTVGATCQATDDLTRQLGDPQEDSTRRALDFLAGRSCTPISSGSSSQSIAGRRPPELLIPEQPSTVQREVPGSF